MSDITAILSSQIPSAVPLFLMGHSMGGAEVLTYAAVGPAHVRKHIRGYLAEAPLIALHPSAAPSRLTVIAGRLASMLLPSRQLVSKLDEKVLSRDPEVVRLYVEDELCHDTGTLQGLAGMLDRGAHLVSGRVKLPVDDNGEGGQLRIWVGHGTEDRVTSFEASRKWMEELKVEDKEFKAYEGWYHKRGSFFFFLSPFFPYFFSPVVSLLPRNSKAGMQFMRNRAMTESPLPTTSPTGSWLALPSRRRPPPPSLALVILLLPPLLPSRPLCKMMVIHPRSFECISFFVRCPLKE